MFEKILVGYDGSTLSDKAVQGVKKIALQNPESEVHVVSAIELTGPSTNMMMSKNITNESIENAEKQLDEIKKECNEVGKEITTKIFMTEKKKNSVQNPESEVDVASGIQITGTSKNMMMTKKITNEIIENVEKQLDEIKKEFNEVGKEITTKIFMSEKNKNPGENICNYAEQNDISMIVVGSRGLGNIKGLFLGSVSNEIVQKANVPVLVMKDY